MADSIILRKFGHQIALQEVVAGSCMRFLEASSTSHVVEEACSMLPAHPTFVTLDWEVRGRWLPHPPIAISCCSLPPIDPSVARPCHVAIDPSPSPGVFSEGSMAVGLQVDSLEGVLASHWSDRKNVSGAANQRGCTPTRLPGRTSAHTAYEGVDGPEKSFSSRGYHRLLKSLHSIDSMPSLSQFKP